jgi:hypothetical protein
VVVGGRYLMEIRRHVHHGFQNAMELIFAANAISQEKNRSKVDEG